MVLVITSRRLAPSAIARTAEGRAVKRSGSWGNYEYFLSDHLGNNVISFDQGSDGNARIIQGNSYYAHGLGLVDISMGHVTGAKNRRLFNKGSELQEDYGLNVYFTKYRTKEQGFPIWWQPDPLASQGDLVNWSPYHFSYCNPIRFNDPDGDQPFGPSFIMLFANVSDYANTLVEAATYTDVNDASVLLMNQHANGDPASLTDKAAAAIGAVLPVVSGSAVLKVAKTIDNVINGTKAADKAVDLQKAEARAAKLSQVQRPGKDFTKAGKDAVKDLSKAKNDGKTICVTCKQETIPGAKDKKGIKPPGNRTEIDHRKRKREGGSGTPDNADVNCRDCNQKKN